MELLLNNYQGLPKGFNGIEWNSMIKQNPRRKELEPYLRQDLPKQNCRKLREKFAKSDFLIMPKIDYFEQFISAQYHKKRCRDNHRSKKKKFSKSFKLNQSLNQASVNNFQLQQTNNNFPKTPNNNNNFGNKQQEGLFDIPANPQISEVNKKQILKQVNRQKKILINDIGYLKLFSDKHSNVKIDCLQKLQEYNNIVKQLEEESNGILNAEMNIIQQTDNILQSATANYPNPNNINKLNCYMPQDIFNSTQKSISQTNYLNSSVQKQTTLHNTNELLSSGIQQINATRQIESAIQASRGNQRYNNNQGQTQATTSIPKTMYNNFYSNKNHQQQINASTLVSATNQLTQQLQEENKKLSNILNLGLTTSDKQATLIQKQQLQQKGDPQQKDPKNMKLLATQNQDQIDQTQVQKIECDDIDEDEEQQTLRLRLQQMLNQWEKKRQQKVRLGFIYNNTLQRKLGIIQIQHNRDTTSSSYSKTRSSNSKSFNQ